jgi:hypothetical protein
MTTKVLTTYLTGAYTLSAAYGAVDVRPGAGAAGGLSSKHQAAIYNYGGRLGGFGVSLGAGGTVDNGLAGYTSASITSVDIEDARGTVVNQGTISAFKQGVVMLADGGFVLNGGDTNTGALIAGVAGVDVGQGGTLDNFGTIKGLGNAVYFTGGGIVVNGSSSDSRAFIQGGEGVFLNLGLGTVTNFGVIDGQVYDGVDLGGGGAVTNGSVIDTDASIIGYAVGVKAAGAATVRNFASITETSAAIGDYGVLLEAGGTVVNGSRSDASAMISGYTGVKLAAGGTVNNCGSIVGLGGASGFGVTLAAGGLVTNGSDGDTKALISGYQGVDIAGTAAGTVNSYGTVIGLGGAYDAGVTIAGAARVFNGVAGLIEGGEGVSLAGGGGVHNDGTIRGVANYGLGGAGVFLTKGGTVYNGTASDRSALIVGDYGVFSQASGTVDNLGTIAGDYRSAGVELESGGAVTNGSTRNAAATITGYDGVKLVGAASLANFGTVTGVGGYGVWLDGAGESVTNGSEGHARASIGGYVGVEVNSGAVTINNFGTIGGYGGTALAVYSGASVFLEVESGGAFQGAVLGNRASTLDLASGTGTLSGLSGAAVTVSGSMATTTFSAFGRVEVGGGAVFALAGNATVLAGQTLVSAGMLTASGSVANAGVLETLGGTLIVSGAVTGAGKVTIANGVADFTSTLANAVTFTASSTGTLELGKSQSYTGAISGFSKTGANFLDLADITFISGTTKATFSGTTTSGVLTVTDGTHTAKINLTGNYTTSTFVVATDGHGGTLIHDPAKAAASAPISPPWWHGPAPLVPFIGAMAGFGTPSGAETRLYGNSEMSQPMIALARHAVVA